MWAAMFSFCGGISWKRGAPMSQQANVVCFQNELLCTKGLGNQTNPTVIPNVVHPLLTWIISRPGSDTEAVFDRSSSSSG